MALPQFHEVLADPKFRDAPVARKKEINDAYWTAYSKENPDDAWGQQVSKDAAAAISASEELETAAPIARRALELQRDTANVRLKVGIADKRGLWSSPEERASFIEQRSAEVAERQQGLKKTFSLFTPEVEKEMAPTWETLSKTALSSGYFEGKRTVRGPEGEVLYGRGIDENRTRYEKLRQRVATDFNLAPEDVDDLVKHRNGLQKDLISRDALGGLHIKDDLLVRGNDDLQRAIVKSNLPDKVKSDLSLEAPLRIASFKAGLIENTKKQHPELAATIKWTGDIDKDYRALNAELNKTRTEQFGGGVAAAAASRSKLLGTEYGLSELFGSKAPGADVKIVRDAAGNVIFKKPPTLSEKGAALEKRLDSINQLSNFINQEKVRILGTDAATVGAGVYSGVESVAIGALTGGLGNAVVSADRIKKAGTAGKVLLGAAQRGLNTAPIASIYGFEQGMETYERTGDLGLSALSAAIEGGVTTAFGAVKLGGVEDVGQHLATPAARAAVGKSVAKAWGQFGLDVGKTIAGEQLEELTISALNDIYVESQLNPGMTVADMKKNLYDTAVSTLFASGPAGAFGAANEQGTNLFKSTYEQTDSELHDTADALYKAAAKENLPEAEAAGGTVAPPSDAGVAPREQYTREEFIAAVEAEKSDPATHPERLAALEGTPEEVAARFDVDLLEPTPQTDEVPQDAERQTNEGSLTPEIRQDEAQAETEAQGEERILTTPAPAETPTESLPEGTVPAEGISGDTTLTEQTDEQDTQDTGREQDTTPPLQLSEVPVEPPAPESAEPVSRPSEATQPAQAQGEAPVRFTPQQIKAASPKLTDQQAEVAAIFGNLLTADLPQEIELETPKLVQGQLFQQGEAPKGTITFAADMGKAWVNLMNGDISTFNHEVAHFLRRFVLDGKSEQALAAAARRNISKEEVGKLAEWAGAKDGVWTTEAEEKFARGVERYLRDGKAPTTALQPIFDKLSEWLKDIYKTIQGSSINIDITDDVKAVFDKLFAGPGAVVTPAAKPAPKPVRKLPELPKPQSRSTSIKNAATDRYLVENGMAPMLAPARQSNEATWDEAMARVEKDDKAGSNVVDKLLASEGSVNDEVEEGVLLHEMAVRKARVARYRSEVIAAHGNEDAVREAQRKLQMAQSELTQAIIAAKLAGTAWGRIGQFRQRAINEDFSLEAMEARFMAEQNDGAPLTADQSKMIAELQKRIVAAEARTAEVEAEISLKEREVQALLKKMEEKANAKPRKTPERRSLTERVSERAQSARDRLASRGLIGRRVTLEQRGESRDAARFAELTATIPAKPTPADLDTWRSANPEAYAELKAMREQVLKDAGYTEKVWKGWVPYTGGDITNFRGEVIASEPRVPITEIRRPSPFPTFVSGEPPLTGVAGFFSKDKGVAESFTRGISLSAQTDEFLVNPDRNLMLDAEGAFAGKLQFEARDSRFRDAVRSGKYDSIWLNNTKDEGDVFILLKSENAKLTEPLNLDPATGRLIPPSQWGDTTSPSILRQAPEETLDPQDIEDLGDVLAESLIKGTPQDEALSNLADSYGSIINLHADEILSAAREVLAKTSAGSRAKTPTELFNLLDPENPEISNKLVFNMVRGYINEGVTKEKVLKKVLTKLQEKFPALTYDELSDIFTGYGKVKFPSQEEDLKAVRELKNIERIQRQIREVKAGRSALKTGAQRDAATARIRELEKELKEAYRAAGIKHTTSASQIKGALDAIETRLKNELEDLDKAIRTTTPISRKKTQIEYDQEIKDLQARRDARRKDYDKLFGVNRKAMTDAQRLKATIKALNKRITEERELARKGLVERIQSSSKPVTDAEVERLRATLTALVEARAKARAALYPSLSEEDRAAKRAETASKRLVDYYQKVLAGTAPGKRAPVKFTPNEELAKLITLKEDLKVAVKEMRKQARLPFRKTKEERSRNAAIKALERSVADLESRVARGDLSPRTRAARRTDLPAELVKRQKSAQDALKALRELQLPSREERREQALIRASETRMKKIQARIAAGDYVKFEKVPAVMSTKLAAARLAESKAKEEWNRGFFEAELAKRTFGKKTYDFFAELLNFSRTMKTIADVSGVLRQGLVTAISHPVLSIKAIPDMFLAGFSEVQHQRIKDRIEAHPLFGLSQQAKLFLSDTGLEHSLSKIEEAFRGRWAKKVPGISSVVGFSERTYSAYLNQVRIAQFANMVEGFTGGNPTVKEAKIIANYVNRATGRGDLKNFESAAAGLAAAFFSPKFVVSRFQILWGVVPTTFNVVTGFQLVPKDVRRAKIATAKEYARLITGISAVYSLAVLAKAGFGDDDDGWELDPRSSSFGRIKIGNIRIDPMGGLLQAATFAARMLPTPNNGVWRPHTKTSSGNVLSLWRPGFGKQSYVGVMGMFLRTKLSPVPSSVINMAQGEDVIGQPVTLRSEAIGSVVPLVFGDVFDILKENGVKGTPLAVAAMFGLGVQVRNEELELEQWLSTLAGVNPQEYEQKKASDSRNLKLQISLDLKLKP